MSEGDSTITYRCGGTLITDRHILTAAHCVNSRAPKPVVARLGVINIKPLNEDEDGTPTDIPILQVTLHPQYVSNRNYHDIAIIVLQQLVPFEINMHPACLRSDLADPSPNQPLIITGWGRIDVNRKLLKLYLTTILIDRETDERFFFF